MKIRVPLLVLVAIHFFASPRLLANDVGTAFSSAVNSLSQNVVAPTLEPNDPELDASWAPQWSSLIGLWHLNDSSHSHTAADSSAKQTETGRLNGGVTLGVPGHLNTAATFDGSRGFIETPLLSGATTGVTLMAWFKSNDFAQAGQMIFFNGSEDGENGYGVALNMENETSGELRVLYGGVLWYDTGVYINDNNWHHFALAIRSDGHPDLYLDGSLVFSGYASVANAPTRYANIGRDDYIVNHPNYPRYFNGVIDEVAFWTADLTTSQIEAIYSRQK